MWSILCLAEVFWNLVGNFVWNIAASLKTALIYSEIRRYIRILHFGYTFWYPPQTYIVFIEKSDDILNLLPIWQANDISNVIDIVEQLHDLEGFFLEKLSSKKSPSKSWYRSPTPISWQYQSFDIASNWERRSVVQYFLNDIW